MNDMPMWRFWLPLFFQTILIAIAPAQAIYTHIAGKTIVLETIPLHRDDVLSDKQSLKLRYPISSIENLQKLPGWETIARSRSGSSKAYIETGTQFYVILQSSRQGHDRAWQPVAISRNRPSDLPIDRVALKGKKSEYFWIDYGLETYKLPEHQRKEIRDRLVQMLQGKRWGYSFAVEIKVDNQGHAIPIGLWIGDNKYQF